MQLTIEEAKEHLTELVNAALKGEEVFIRAADEQDEQIVRLVAVPPRRGHPQFGSAKGVFTMSDDFDDPLPEFEEYMR